MCCFISHPHPTPTPTGVRPGTEPQMFSQDTVTSHSPGLDMRDFYCIILFLKLGFLLPRLASSSLLAEAGQHSDPPASAYRALG